MAADQLQCTTCLVNVGSQWQQNPQLQTSIYCHVISHMMYAETFPWQLSKPTNKTKREQGLILPKLYDRHMTSKHAICVIKLLF